MWNKEELPQRWMVSVTAPVYEEGNKTYCSNWQGIPPLTTSHKILANILPSRLSVYTNEITGNHLSTNQIVCIHQIVEKTKCNGAAMPMTWLEEMYNLLIQSAEPMKPLRLIKMCLNKTCNKVHSFDALPIQNGLKQ
jgi:hypothetical protein